LGLLVRPREEEEDDIPKVDSIKFLVNAEMSKVDASEP